MKKYIAEFVGTFILIFVGTGSVIVNSVTDGDVSLVGIAMAWGLVVSAMIYAIGDLSGAHINPAVTIAFWVGKRFEGRKVVPYIVAQCAGAIAASLLLRFLYPDQESLGATLPVGTVMQSFVLEIMLTLMLMFVVLNVTVGAKEKGITAGLAIGGVISFEVLCGGPISGASMNPARSLAPALVGGQMQHLWVYLVAPVIGSVAAVPISHYLHSEREQTPEAE
ncbi:MIP/aquaporin family protein [Roseiconus lacunae]|uniref:MIP/aquaporin family protein n=1 Tax=Roseiconus lacunae TaxID=2605694 RepID=A0ABT7PMG6_9BACT|nr:MIP/aquaporin family protein [Roseiconus lacunae]MDM4017471.1 MIP/aquaporin family protein [Roseiconus lacunae]